MDRESDEEMHPPVNLSDEERSPLPANESDEELPLPVCSESDDESPLSASDSCEEPPKKMHKCDTSGSKERSLPPHVKYWLSPDVQHDCYFLVGPECGNIERIGAFKTFLIGYSEPFRVMLQDSLLAEKGDVAIVDVLPATFRNFLECLYVGGDCTNIRDMTLEECVDLLYIVEKYQVMHVKTKLTKLLINQVQLIKCFPSEMSKVFPILSSLVVFQNDKLERELKELVQTHIEKLLSYPMFMNISSEALLWILKLDPLETEEIKLWNTVIKWACHNTKSNNNEILRMCILKHLKYIRFCSMSPDHFCKLVVPSNILSHSEVYEICKSFSKSEANKPMEFICHNPDRRRKPITSTKIKTSFSFCVNNVSNVLAGTQFLSSKFEFCDYEWQVIVEAEEDRLGVYLENLSIDSLRTSCLVQIETILISPNGYENYLRKNISSNTFDKKNNCWGHSNFCLHSELLDPCKNYVQDNSIIILMMLKKEK